MALQNNLQPFHRAFPVKGPEQAPLFFLNPSGNALEFKAFKNLDSLFAK